MRRTLHSLPVCLLLPSAQAKQQETERKEQGQDPTFHQDLYCVLSVLNAVHDLAAINPGVVGSQGLDLQRGVAGDGRVVGQGDHLPVLAVQPDPPSRGHQQDNFSPVGELAPLDPWGQHGTGVLLLWDVEVARDVQGASQDNTQGRLLRYLDFQAITTVCQFPNRERVTSITRVGQSIPGFHVIQCLYLLCKPVPTGPFCSSLDREVMAMITAPWLLLRFGPVLGMGMKGAKGSAAA